MNFTVESAAYHRNGVGGEGFYTGIASCDIDGETHRMLVTFFPHTHLGVPCPAGKKVEDGKRVRANGRVAVVDIDIASAGKVGFGANSWRGDNFYDVADALVAEVESAYKV